MSENEQSPATATLESGKLLPRKLRWWFWVVLFAPALLFVSVMPAPPVMKVHLHGNEIWIARIVWGSFAVLNVVCSLLAAAHLERTRTGHSATAWILPVGVLFFFLNLVVSFGGCMVLSLF